ncbi:SIALI-17 repeat-containing surface protein, partial [Streptococcus sp. 714]|uniref:SIALI-17 repeat-containing surface protein n=1 Tax=Streptococcus sp. 714 TaxID=2582653 RepID=UPI001F038367
ANAVEAAKSEVPSYEGGANAVEAVKSELPSYESGAHEVQPASSNLPTLADSVNKAEAAVHKGAEYKAAPSTAVQAMAQEHTYQAPEAQQHLLPKTGSEDKSSLAIVGFVGMFLGLLMIGKKRE